jgi:hypothetical protein
MSRWFYTPDNKQRLGPVTSEELRALALSGTISPDCMVMPEGGGKWVPASRVEGLFPKPAPAASPPIATVLFPCPKCGRAIPLQQHELSWTIECSRCGSQFVPSKSAVQAEPASHKLYREPHRTGAMHDVLILCVIAALGLLVGFVVWEAGLWRSLPFLFIVGLAVLLLLVWIWLRLNPPGWRRG